MLVNVCLHLLAALCCEKMYGYISERVDEELIRNIKGKRRPFMSVAVFLLESEEN